MNKKTEKERNILVQNLSNYQILLETPIDLINEIIENLQSESQNNIKVIQKENQEIQKEVGNIINDLNEIKEYEKYKHNIALLEHFAFKTEKLLIYIFLVIQKERQFKRNSKIY